MARGRKRIYPNSAAREAHYRDTKHRVDFLTSKEVGETLKEISEVHEISQNALINAMVKFALTNHDWKREILWGLTK